MENGIREEFIGSNPHSNGDIFSRSQNDFLDSKVAKYITIIEINKIKKHIKKIVIIIYTKLN